MPSNYLEISEINRSGPTGTITKAELEAATFAERTAWYDAMRKDIKEARCPKENNEDKERCAKKNKECCIENDRKAVQLADEVLVRVKVWTDLKDCRPVMLWAKINAMNEVSQIAKKALLMHEYEEATKEMEESKAMASKKPSHSGKSDPTSRRNGDDLASVPVPKRLAWGDSQMKAIKIAKDQSKVVTAARKAEALPKALNLIDELFSRMEIWEELEILRTTAMFDKGEVLRWLGRHDEAEVCDAEATKRHKGSNKLVWIILGVLIVV